MGNKSNKIPQPAKAATTRQDFIMEDSEFIALLPRTLREGDTITAEAVISEDAAEVSMKLGTANTLDEDNIPFSLQVDFANEATTVSTTFDGEVITNSADHILTPGSEFHITLHMKQNKIHITLGTRYYETVRFQHELSDIKTMHFTGHFASVKRLEFKFA